MTDISLRIICIVTALVYYASFICTFFKSKYSGRVSVGIWIVAVAMNAVIVGNNWIVNGYMPFVSMYQVLTFLSLTFAIVYIYVRYMHSGAFMRRYFIVAQGVIMTGVSCMDQTSEWSFPPALQSAYFIPHVFSYMISYSLVAVAAILCVVSIVKERSGNSSELRIYEWGMYNLVCTAFPFMVCGMLLGALWANACWGNYWSWDNKEVWSLVTTLALCVYLHFRRCPSLKKYSKYFIIAAFAFEIITLFFVNMFGGSSVHSYN